MAGAKASAEGGGGFLLAGAGAGGGFLWGGAGAATTERRVGARAARRLGATEED